ncbi:hypothetical protein DFR69_107389 [Nocardia neocaledoniensis]|uniref:Uncharacterized protein n=1 Tax=Nocardia neocaledoniensis TaxID=236511 RepID=A0A317NJ55_9NOCA|nr:hypothetical protein DFR69_107389 [Nocardia neocaledoniensis]
MTPSPPSPRPYEPDIHLTIEFPTLRMEFAACLTAAMVFVCEAGTRRLCLVAVDTRPCDGLPRLPAERLYLQP